MPSEIENKVICNKITKLVLDNGGYLIVELPCQDDKYKIITELPKRADLRSLLVKDSKIVASFKPNRIELNVIGVSASSSVKTELDNTKKFHHSYVPPKFHKDVVSLLTDNNPHNIFFSGPTGCGKTEYVDYLAYEVGMEKYGKPIPVFKIDGKSDILSSGFLGDTTVEIDSETKQNKIVFKDGPAIQAMKQGLDKNGNEIPNEPFGILFIDEVATLPSNIFIAINRLLETRNPSRKITLDKDGGRQVHSHTKFRIICAGNTIGRGLLSQNEMLYTAQGDALDISTLDRLTGVFIFGYNKTAEVSILKEKVNDDRTIARILKFRDTIRARIRTGELSTPFSTRTIVGIADLYRVWNSITKAIYYGVFNRLPENEKITYNELAKADLSIDILSEFNMNSDMDFM